ncbi:glycosyltransferase, partial [Burkholderia thailandensis]|nr:glycosyltransferase [Burkholderia thailandensis]
TWMAHVGLDAFVAENVDDFVAKGIALASDIPTLARLRGELRERCTRSAAFQPERVAQDVSDAFRIMWRRWRDGQPPVSFAGPPRDTTTTVAGDRA